MREERKKAAGIIQQTALETFVYYGQAHAAAAAAVEHEGEVQRLVALVTGGILSPLLLCETVNLCAPPRSEMCVQCACYLPGYAYSSTMGLQFYTQVNNRQGRSGAAGAALGC